MKLETVELCGEPVQPEDDAPSTAVLSMVSESALKMLINRGKQRRCYAAVVQRVLY